jgi:hypothetical protein
MKKFYLTFAFLLIGFTLAAQKLPFQGYLEESDIPVNGTRTFVFELPDYAWSETIADVPIDNGIYNVVLGESTPLPEMIFRDTTETPLEITIDGVSIGFATLYKPLVNTNSLLTTDGNLEIKGPNDSLNLRVGSFNPYYGSVNLFDSLGAQQGFLSADPLGGRLQLNQRNGSGALTSAIVARTNSNKSYSQYYGSNPSGTGISRLIENYITEREIAGGPEMSGGYLRSGSDWYDNEGTLLAAIGNARDEAGSDPTGKSGYLSLWGSNSFNIELTGKRWENNDLPIFQLFGSNDDGGGWFLRNFGAEVLQGPGTTNYSNISLNFTDNAGAINNENVLISSNFLGSSAGGLELRDSTGNTTAILEARGNGNSGQLKLRGTTGADLAAIQNRGGNSGQAIFFGPSGGLRTEIGSFGDDSGFLITYGPNGNKNVQLDRDPGNTNLGQLTLFDDLGNNSVFATAATDGSNRWGTLTVNGPNNPIDLDGLTGQGFFANAAIGQQTNGIIHLYGEQGATTDNLRLQLEVRPDGGGSSFGFIEVRDSAFNSTIQIDGNSGNINASGTISGSSVVQTSDKRYKKEISTLDNSLENTLKLRGVSYYWKQENKSKKRQIGVIAQEIEEVYPEFVHTNDEGYKSVNYAQMTAVLIEAIKELNAKIVKLEAEKADLTAALNETKELSERIGKLEKLLLEGTEVSSN